jgi:hypothetical protein
MQRFSGSQDSVAQVGLSEGVSNLNPDLQREHEMVCLIMEENGLARSVIGFRLTSDT